MNRKILIVIVFASLALCSCIQKDVSKMTSPEQIVSSDIKNIDGTLVFNIKYKDRIISDSCIAGFTGSNYKLKIEDITRVQVDNTWESVNGKNLLIRNNYNEYIFDIGIPENPDAGYKIIFRLYDDGIAFRYLLNNKGVADIEVSDQSQIIFKKDPVFWSYNGENHNIGPEKLAKTELRTIRPPALFKIDNDLYAAILEAGIFNHGPFQLVKGEHPTSLKTEPQQEEWGNKFETSWRVIQLGENAGQLIESDILVNLNDESNIDDTSWIKPGKVMWDWRVWGYEAPDGFIYGLNTPSHVRFVDFASENNIQYLLLDADWYGPEFSSESDPTSANSAIDITGFMEYAIQKNIGVILYLNDVGAKKFGLERVLKQFSDWGAVGVKYGFMRGSWEEKVKQTRLIVELCAKNRLMVNFHDNPVPPSGDRRTWPNLLTKEFCHSQADALRSYYPETAVTSVFVNMLAGPLDMCTGWFDFNTSISRVKVFEEIPGTIASELAKLVIYYSGWHVLPDAPEEYLRKNDMFDFIREMPVQFDNYKVLKGDVGEYISVARKNGDKWFIGSLTNRSQRDIDLELNFLEPGIKYQATIYGDAEKTHYMDNREDYSIQYNLTVTSDTILKLKLAEGGGNAVIIKKQ